MNYIEIIKKKRDGKHLTAEEINLLVNRYTKKQIPDYQFSAFLMAAFINGMNKNETAALTKAMLYSGKVIDLSSIAGAKIDKHSTGGVGDKTSLILAPIAAAAGVNVPMISGRGLGHSGGTLDKLESIPGFTTNLSLSGYIKAIKKVGAVLIGQTKDIAPADKLIYALRDVTGTVESIPLITGSIMSKKLAEGIDGLVLDVKTGNGAFMRKTSDAVLLADSLIDTAKAFNKKVIAFITDMNQPLGNYVGNWLEVYESVLVLKGERKDDLYKLSTLLSGAMIYLAGKSSSVKEGVKISEKLIDNGKAFEKFLEIIKNQNGDIRFIKNPDLYPKPKFIDYVYSKESGFISKINCYQIGLSAIDLGAGRKTKEDKIEPKAGLILKVKIGDRVKINDPLVEIHCDSKEKIDSVKSALLESFRISKKTVSKPKLIKKIIIN